MLFLLNERVFVPLLIVTITVCSLFLTIKLSFLPFIKPKKLFLAFKGTNGLKSACLSLAGTLGVGNISGVASAIICGGPGAVLWMWIFAFAAMIIKYSEIVLSLRYKHKDSCGTAFYLEKGLNSKRLAVVFSILIVISSFGMGNIIQSSAAAQGFYTCFKIPKIVTGAIFSLLTLILVLGGRKRVSRFSSYIVPILSVCYFLVSIAIIISNVKAVPAVLEEIVRAAFSGRAFGGGVLGVVFSKGAKLGASRGVLSNEAGCGTSTYAQDPKDNECAKGGAWGIFEVFVDTVVLCTLTALVILLVPNSLSDAMGSVIYSYSYFGLWGGYFIAVSSWFFALASVVCWSYYGTSAVRYLTNKKTARVLYLLLYSAAGVIGSVFAPSLVWEISDITVSVMAIFNTICVCALWKSVKNETDLYFS